MKWEVDEKAINLRKVVDLFEFKNLIWPVSRAGAIVEGALSSSAQY